MGLLDNPQDAAMLQLGLGLLSAGGPSRMPVSLGQGIAQAGQGAMDEYRRTQMMQHQMAQRKMQEQMQQMQMDEMMRKQKEAQMIRQAAKESMLSPQAQAISNGGPTQANADMIQNLRPQFDSSGFVDRLYGIDPMMAMEMKDKMTPKPIKLGAEESLLDPKTYKPIATGVGKKDQLGKLIDERNSLPTGHPDRALYDKAIEKATTHPLPVQNTINNISEKEQSKVWGKTLGELRSNIATSAFSAPAKLAQLDRMEQLLSGVEGGKLSPLGADIASMANSLGLKVDPKLGNKEAAQALSREIAGSFRQPGTGPMTDKDFDNFLMRVPDLSKTVLGRQEIFKTMRAALQRDMQADKITRQYAQQHGGNIDDGLVDVLADFYARNPVVAAGGGDVRAKADAIIGRK